MSERKPGVYICKGCGIGEAVDCGALESLASGDLKVPVVRQHDVLCSEDGVATIEKDVAGGAVNQPIIAACSQRVMADRFEFDGAGTVRTNLREWVAWARPAGAEDTQMAAADQIRMGVAQASKMEAPEARIEEGLSTRIMVVGGGSTGLNAALEAVAAGHEVLLVEKTRTLGGWSAKWSKRMPHRPPYRDPQDNDIAALIEKVQGNKAIAVKTETTVAETSGMPGKFEVSLVNGASATKETVGAIVVATGWRPYDATKLGHLGYGASPDVVTGIELEGMLADGGVKRKSDGAAPNNIAFVLCAGSRDPEHLPYCSSVCCGASIKQALQIRAANPDAMAYIIFQELRTPGTAEEFYRQAQEAGIVFMKGKVKSVGSDLTVTVDDALLGQEVPMAGLDMVVLATGMVPNGTDPDKVSSENGAEQLANDINPVAPIARAGDGEAAGPAWSTAAPDGGAILNLRYRQGPHLPMLADGFADSHFICFPYETRRTGIYTCGPVRRPMDIAESAEDAAGAVLKAIQAIRGAQAGMSVHPRVGDLSFPKFGLDICTKCRRCTVECPFGAIEENDEGYPVLSSTRCRRCGTCMGACPVRTISFDNYNVQMVSEMIGAVEIPDEFSEKYRILILACENDAAPALDMAGINRHTLNAEVRVIPVRCLGSVSMLWISDAFQRGYDGAMLMGCRSGDDYQCHFIKGSLIGQERMKNIGETLQSLMLEDGRARAVEVSIADSAKVGKMIDEFVEEIRGYGMNPFKGF
ncbi:MAG: hydrogenase iron-sulfur subunit [Alphaproteobacteria bacterium]|nr:hydrogenase iron-sulfur subunit [Alphaproteobacteria bacterium]